MAIGGGISAQPLLIELINKNLDEIYEHLGFDVYHPEIVACKFRNDANIAVQFLQAFFCAKCFGLSYLGFIVENLAL